MHFSRKSTNLMIFRPNWMMRSAWQAIDQLNADSLQPLEPWAAGTCWVDAREQ